MPIGRAKLLGQLHGLVERHAVRQLGVRLQFVQAQPQNRVLDRVELLWRDFAQSRQTRIQRLAIGSNGLDQSAKIFQIDAGGLGIGGELLLDVLPGKRIDLNLIKRLQRQATRQTAGPMGGRP